MEIKKTRYDETNDTPMIAVIMCLCSIALSTRIADES